MPKKPPRNAFYFYMIDFKEEQRKKGIHYANMAEVADAAGPLWRDAPPPVRSKFETIAKKEKEKFNVPQHKYTSNGISYAEIDQQMREQQEAIKYERNDIKNMVTCKGLGYSVNLLDIYVIDVNSYCKVNTGYLIGECTLLRFNLQEGYKEYYHEVINPVHIPVGYVSDVKAGCQELGLDMPDESKPTAPLPSVLANIVDYLKQSDPESNILPPMFTLPEKVAPVMDFIHQLCRRAGEDETLFRVYQLDTLFFTLANAFKTRPDEGFPKESLARDKLKRDPFKYTPDLGCEHHENDEREKSVECTLSRVKRWAFTVLDTCCPIAGIDMVPGKHVPADFDLVKIHEFQEQKKIRTAPSVAQVMAASAASRNTTLSPYTTRSANSSVSTSTEVAVETVKKEKRVHVPLRQPKTDYSERLAAPPELCSTEFPSLPVRGSRGRGMSSGINRLKLDE